MSGGQLFVDRCTQELVAAVPHLVDRQVPRCPHAEAQKTIGLAVPLNPRRELPGPEQRFLHHDFDVHLGYEAPEARAHRGLGAGNPAGEGLRITGADRFQVDV